MVIIGKKEKNDIKSNRDFWIPKIEQNIKRDKDVNEYLTSNGWKVLKFWGKEITKNVSACADIIENALQEK